MVQFEATPTQSTAQPAQHEFGMISDQTELHDTKFNYHSITAILKSQNSVSTYILLIK